MTSTAVPTIEVSTDVDIKKYKVHIWSRPLLLVEALILAHVGVLIVAAIYYGVFETTYTMHHWWHQVVSDSATRHNIRDVGEGVLGALMAKAVLWNHFTKSHLKCGRIFDEWHDKYHIPRFLAALLSAAVVFAVTFGALSLIIDHAFTLHVSNAPPTGSWWSRTESLWKSDWNRKALAFVCAFVSSRPLHNTFDDIQGYFAGRRVDLGKTPRIWEPVTFKNRFRYLTDHPHQIRHYAKGINVLVMIGVVAAFGLAVWGYWILTYVA